MKNLIAYGSTSNVLRVKLLDSSSTTGAGLTGLTSSSAGLIIAMIWDNEATTTAYTQAGGTIESITTLGTYAAPTATKCRFKEVDSTNHKGVYELHIADARFAVVGAKRAVLSISGATNLAQYDAEIEGLTGSSFGSDGVASAATSTTITLQSGQSYATNALRYRTITIIAGTGVGQSTVIASNTNASPSVCTINGTWITTPDTTSQYVLGAIGDPLRACINESNGSITHHQALNIVLAGVAGTEPSDGVFKDPSGASTRISGTAASSAPFRTAVTLTPSS